MNQMSRRRLLRSTGLVAAGVPAMAALSACSLLSTEPEKKGSGDGGDEQEREKPAEAPMLTELVESGDLPPVGERLPKNPLVVEPTERVGQYGGMWRTALNGAADTPYLTRTVQYDYLLRWTPEWDDDPIPNLAASFEVLEDGSVFEFVLREGLKWSDGEPFTTADIEFAYQDTMLNPDLAPSGPSTFYLSEDGEPAELEVVDEITFRLVYSSPSGLLVPELAGPAGGGLTTKPRHFLEKFHADYNDKADELAREGGFESWVELFLDAAALQTNPDLPTMYAWRFTTALGEGSKVELERNPYYWKVDPEGSQLPYLDGVSFEVIEDAEVMLLKASEGEFGLHTRHINELSNKPVLAEGAAERDFRLIDMTPALMNEMVIFLNITHEKPALREVFSNKDFRIGLSHAINRQNLINGAFQRQGEPWQAAPRRECAVFDEEFAKQYTEYDVDLANEYLDKAGYAERNPEGIRLGPDGKPIHFQVLVAQPALKEVWADAMDLVRADWEEVGVSIEVNSIDRTLWSERVDANKHDAGVWLGDGGSKDVIAYGYYYLPYHIGSRYAIAWYDWYASGGEAGEEPPAEALRQLEVYDKVKATADIEEQLELYTEIVEIAKEQFWCIGTVALESEYAIVRNDFHNVTEGMPNASRYPTPGPTNPEQYFIAP